MNYQHFTLPKRKHNASKADCVPSSSYAYLKGEVLVDRMKRQTSTIKINFPLTTKQDSTP